MQTLELYAAQQFPSEVTGFDWMNAFKSFLNLNLEKNDSKYPDPGVSISSISNTGKISISFTNKMFVPPLDEINKAAIPVKSHARTMLAR